MMPSPFEPSVISGRELQPLVKHARTHPPHLVPPPNSALVLTSMFGRPSGFLTRLQHTATFGGRL